MIGHHAHVPQPIVRLAGGPGGAGMWVAHGLGNYLSNQDADCCSSATSSGVLLTARVERPAGRIDDDDEVEPARVAEVAWTPITVDRRASHTLHALDEIPDGTGTLSPSEVAERVDRCRTAVGPEAQHRTTPATETGPPPAVIPRTVEQDLP